MILSSLAAPSLCTRVMQFRSNTGAAGGPAKACTGPPPQESDGCCEWMEERREKKEKSVFGWGGCAGCDVMVWSLSARGAACPLTPLSPLPWSPPIPSLSAAPQRMAPPPPALPLRPPHQCGSSDGREVSSKVDSVLYFLFPVQAPTWTHLCHDVSVRHVKMVDVELTARKHTGGVRKGGGATQVSD